LPLAATFSSNGPASHGARNCPFFTFTGFPARATSSRKSVWRQRKAGVCSRSATSAHDLRLPHLVHVGDHGTPISRFTSARMRSPSSMPGPRAEPIEVRFALSKDDL
jgi:hypothetical protein